MIVAGDVGGTKTELALCDLGSGVCVEQRRASFRSQDYASLEAILAEFLGDEKVVLGAGCFGVPGAVIDGRCETTNLPWVLDEQKLAKAISAPRVKLINDLEAATYGMLQLGNDEVHVLQKGTLDRPGNIAVIAAGTGLGEGMALWDGMRHQAIASEGGHCDFAPRNDLEVELWQALGRQFGGHVSYERILSGPGIFNVYRFLRERSGEAEPAWLSERIAAGDPTAAVSRAALSEGEPVCRQTLELFASIYGAEAGNLALKCVASGGVYVGGGIAPKLLPVLQDGRFIAAFVDKGRFRELLEQFEVRVALNPRTAVLGAAHYANKL